MKRLLVMQFWANRRGAAGLLALAAIAIALGDPVAFRGLGPGFAVLIVGALWMGLASYSSELAGEALPFALSLPLRSRDLALAKVLVGLGVCAVVSVGAAALYAVRVPSLYRPFMDSGSLGAGLLLLAGSLSLAFLFGFAFSALAPGAALSFAVCVSATVVWEVVSIGLQGVFAESEIPVAAALIGATIAVVRAPAILQPWCRRRRWAVGGALGVLAAICFQYGARAVGHGLPTAGERPTQGGLCSASPDRRSTVYWPFMREARPSEVWIRYGGGRYRRVDSAPRANFIAWSPDSEAVYYAAGTNESVQLKRASAADGWSPRVVVNLPKPARAVADARGYLETFAEGVAQQRWSPSGRRLAMEVDALMPGGAIVAVDTRSRSVLLTCEGMSAGFWWIDEDRLGVCTLAGRIIVLPADGGAAVVR